MTEVYLIRHAEAEGNIFRRLHGQYDSLLTPRGFRQVRCLEARFASIPIDACFASDLTRASLTALAVSRPKGLRLRRDPRFREVDVGCWEDLPYGYLDNFEEEGMRQFNHDPVHWHVDGSEVFEEYTQRCIEGLRAAAEAFDGGTVAVVSHGAVLRGTLMRLFPRQDGTKYSDNTGVCLLRYHKGAFTYDYLNDNSHIPGELSTFYIQRWWRETDNRRESALYFLPADQTALPAIFRVPDAGQTFAGMLAGRPVGFVTLGEPEGSTGQILRMALLPELEGRYYADQLLGCAFSYFRRLGCTSLRAAPGPYPDDLLERYAFDPQTRTINIDPGIYRWED